MIDFFINNWNWPIVLFVYILIGTLLSKGVVGFIPRTMSIVGWPIELTQRLTGTRSLPYFIFISKYIDFWFVYFSSSFYEFWFFCNRRREY